MDLRQIFEGGRGWGGFRPQPQNGVSCSVLGLYAMLKFSNVEEWYQSANRLGLVFLINEDLRVIGVDPPAPTLMKVFPGCPRMYGPG